MRDVAQRGRTILFVSHAMAHRLRCATRADPPRARSPSPTRATSPAPLTRYVSALSETHPPTEIAQARRSGTGQLRFTSAAPTKDLYDCDEPKVIEFSLQRRQPTGDKAWVSCHVSERGRVTSSCNATRACSDRWVDIGETYNGRFVLTNPWLKPGTYYVDLFLCSNSEGVIDAFERACKIEIRPQLPYPVTTTPDGYGNGVVFADFTYVDGFQERTGGADAANNATRLS